MISSKKIGVDQEIDVVVEVVEINFGNVVEIIINEEVAVVVSAKIIIAEVVVLVVIFDVVEVEIHLTKEIIIDQTSMRKINTTIAKLNLLYHF
jgi:hypothetical protein